MKSFQTIQRLVEVTTHEDIIERIQNEISESCKPFLSEWNGTHLMWRGMTAPPNTPIFTKRPRHERRPLSIKVDTQVALDDMMHIEGAKALRGNSVFVTSDFATAVDYAANHGRVGRASDVFAIFPVGEFNYSWFEGSTDLYMTMEEHPLIKRAIAAGDATILGKDWLNLHFDDGTLNQALSRRCELMVHAESFICVREEWAKKLGR